jgi:carbon-monoxide dehydrogenase small subunit
MSHVEVTLRANGQERSASVEPRKTLADFLREDLELTGTHVGCEHGVCGACTVLVNGASARSCLMLAVQADGAEITTIEGLADGDAWHPLQEAMRDSHAFQCGFCTPGVLMTAIELLRDNPSPTEVEVQEAISGNLCRCTGYRSIIDGILLAAGRAGCR